MARKGYKTAVRASELIEALCDCGEEADVVYDEDCYPIIEDAYLTSEPGEPCSVNYKVGCLEDTPTRGVSAGLFRFSCMGVDYEVSRNFDGDEDFSDEVLSGRKICYDEDPETGVEFSESDVLEAIHDNVYFPAYDPDDYELQWDEDNIVRAKECLEDSVPDGYDCSYAVDETGTVWLFDEENPMPTKGFTQISLREACRRMAESQQNFEEVY